MNFAKFGTIWITCPSAMLFTLFKLSKEAPHPDLALLKTSELDTVSKIYSNSCHAILPLAVHKKEPCFGRVCVCNICKDVKLLVLSFSTKGSSPFVFTSAGGATS